MTQTLSEQLADYRASWRARVPADKQTLMDQHVTHLAATGIDRAAKQVGDRAPAIRLRDQHGATFDVGTLLAKGPVVVTFYRGGWCPFSIWNSRPTRPCYRVSRQQERAWWRSVPRSRMIP